MAINKAIILGNLGKDPETKYQTNGDAICNFSIATTDKWIDKASGEKREATEWHNVSAFGKLALICSEYLKKGAQVYVEGKIKTRKYTDKDGIERYATGITIDQMQMLGGRGEPASAPAKPYTRQANPSSGSQLGDIQDSDDVPF